MTYHLYRNSTTSVFFTFSLKNSLANPYIKFFEKSFTYLLVNNHKLRQKGANCSAKMNRRWICSDVWMDILPSFDHAQLGLKIALLSDRFDVLVDAHFDGKSELTIWRRVRIRKGIGPKAKLCANGTFVAFPLPDRPLPNKIRFRDLNIWYIDHSVIAFLRSNKQIWERSGTDMELNVDSDEAENDVQPIWDVFIRQIWPIFATNLRYLRFSGHIHLDNLRRRTSPTILTDLDQLDSIDSGGLFPDVIADDGPNATSGQALSKWLHTPSKDGQPKQLHYNGYFGLLTLKWINNFKEAFLRATTSSSYIIQLNFYMTKRPNEPFEFVNEGTNEKLILWKKSELAVETMSNYGDSSTEERRKLGRQF